MSRVSVMMRRSLRRLLSPMALRLLHFRCKYGPNLTNDGDEKLTVVVASFVRPENIQLIVDSLVKCLFVDKIIITNHNPDIKMEDYIRATDSRVNILNSPTRKPPGYRFDVAVNSPGHYFHIHDDDVHMYPEQLRWLFRHLLDDPSVPHGFHGTRFVTESESRGPISMYHVARREDWVDVLHQGYAVTRSHIERMMHLRSLIISSEDYNDDHPDTFADDILISQGGTGKARIHNLWPIVTCPSSLEPSVAVSGQQDFGMKRAKLYLYLKKKISDSGEWQNCSSPGVFE